MGLTPRERAAFAHFGDDPPPEGSTAHGLAMIQAHLRELADVMAVEAASAADAMARLIESLRMPDPLALDRTLMALDRIQLAPTGHEDRQGPPQTHAHDHAVRPSRPRPVTGLPFATGMAGATRPVVTHSAEQETR